MGLFGSIFNLGVDLVTLPLSVASDVVSTVSGDEPTSTKENLEEIGDDLSDVLEDIF